MPRKPTPAPSTPAPAVPTIAELSKLPAKDQCARFADRATVNQRAFAEMGKLHHLISAGLKKGQTIYGELRKLGVKDSTISNASYAAKIVELVKAGHVTEAQYDGFTFADCLAVCRVMGDRSARKLTGEEVKAVIAAAPDTFDAEFESIHATGLTVAEEIAQAKAKADAEAKAEAARKAAEQAEMQRKADEQAAADLAAKQAAEQIAQADANPPPAAQTEPAPANTEPEPAPAGPTSTETAPTPIPAASTPAAESPATDTTAPAPTAASEPPSNVEQMPEDPDNNLPAVLEDLDSILAEVSEMTVDAKKIVFARLNAMMAHLDTAINTPAAQAA